VTNAQAMDLVSYTSVHMFTDQPNQLADITIHQMGCGWNQSHAPSNF
jgi:hypothetical protein